MTIAPQTSSCGDGEIWCTEQCDDGNTDDGDCCSSTCQFEAQGSACTDDGNVCTDDECNGEGTCDAINNTVSCDDLNACTQTDTCANGACVGGNPVACTASDQCHDAGECNSETGECTDPAKQDGIDCSDSLYCTDGDSCFGGVCGSGATRDCSDGVGCTDDSCDDVIDQCVHTPNDTHCDDSIYCNGAETCDPQLGCQVRAAVDCSYMDGDCVIGLCNEDRGACVVNPWHVGSGCCGVIATRGNKPFATDCLGILQHAVAKTDCAPFEPCICDVDGSGHIIASDALLCLYVAVGTSQFSIECQCGANETSQTRNSTTTTKTPTPTATTTSTVATQR